MEELSKKRNKRTSKRENKEERGEKKIIQKIRVRRTEDYVALKLRNKTTGK